jgi:hypothetical protein
LQHVEAMPNSISSGYLTDAPFLIRNSTVSKSPNLEAKCNGVSSLVVTALTNAPFSISKATVSNSSHSDAKCNGVSLLVVTALTYARYNFNYDVVQVSHIFDVTLNLEILNIFCVEFQCEVCRNQYFVLDSESRCVLQESKYG